MCVNKKMHGNMEVSVMNRNGRSKSNAIVIITLFVAGAVAVVIGAVSRNGNDLLLYGMVFGGVIAMIAAMALLARRLTAIADAEKGAREGRTNGRSGPIALLSMPELMKAAFREAHFRETEGTMRRRVLSVFRGSFDLVATIVRSEDATTMLRQVLEGRGVDSIGSQGCIRSRRILFLIQYLASVTPETGAAVRALMEADRVNRSTPRDSKPAVVSILYDGERQCFIFADEDGPTGSDGGFGMAFFKRKILRSQG
jgi:hypothetical protein